MKKQELLNALNARYYNARSAWARGVVNYAIELVDGFEGDAITEKALLSGARDWHEYSEGGMSLIYNQDICERLCTPSEIKRKHYGELQPNSRETWLDVQARALYQACRVILDMAQEEE